MRYYGAAGSGTAHNEACCPSACPAAGDELSRRSREASQVQEVQEVQADAHRPVVLRLVLLARTHRLSLAHQLLILEDEDPHWSLRRLLHSRLDIELDA